MRISGLLWLLSLVLFLLSIAAPEASLTTPLVSVSLTDDWELAYASPAGSQLYQESLCFLAQSSLDLLPFVQTLKAADLASDNAVYHSTRSYLSRHSDAPWLDLYDMTISTAAFRPKIMHEVALTASYLVSRQMTQGPLFAMHATNGQLFSTIEALQQHFQLTSPSAGLEPHDSDVLASGSAGHAFLFGGPTIEYYLVGDPNHDPAFYLAWMALFHKSHVSVRTYYSRLPAAATESPRTSASIGLCGWGIELVYKNTEYLVMNQLGASNLSSAATSFPSHKDHGFERNQESHSLDDPFEHADPLWWDWPTTQAHLSWLTPSSTAAATTASNLTRIEKSRLLNALLYTNASLAKGLYSLCTNLPYTLAFASQLHRAPALSSADAELQSTMDRLLSYDSSASASDRRDEIGGGGSSTLLYMNGHKLNTEFFNLFELHEWMMDYALHAAHASLSLSESVELNATSEVFQVWSDRLLYIRETVVEPSRWASESRLQSLVASESPEQEGLYELVLLFDPSSLAQIHYSLQVVMMTLQKLPFVTLAVLFHPGEASTDRDSEVVCQILYELGKERGTGFVLAVLEKAMVIVANSETGGRRLDSRFLISILGHARLVTPLQQSLWASLSTHMPNGTEWQRLAIAFPSPSHTASLYLNGEKISATPSNSLLDRVYAKAESQFAWYQKECQSGNLTPETLNGQKMTDYWRKRHELLTHRNPIIFHEHEDLEETIAEPGNELGLLRMIPLQVIQSSFASLLQFKLWHGKGETLSWLWFPVHGERWQHDLQYLCDYLHGLHDTNAPHMYLLVENVNAKQLEQLQRLTKQIDSASISELIKRLQELLLLSPTPLSAPPLSEPLTLTPQKELWSELRQGFPSQMQLLIANGRLIRCWNLTACLAPAEISTLLAYEQRCRPTNETHVNATRDADSILRSLCIRHDWLVNSVRRFRQLKTLVSDPTSRHLLHVLYGSEEHRRFFLHFGQTDKEKALFQFLIALDPTSHESGKMLSFVRALSAYPSVSIAMLLYTKELPTMNMVPDDKQQQQPAKSYPEKPARFTRFAFRPAPAFQGTSRVGWHVDFQSLPTETLLTMGLESPKGWHILPRSSTFDLDNLMLQQTETPQNIRVEYQLESLLIEGSAWNEAERASPRGLQLSLMQDSVEVDESIVMANYGYFQLKTGHPGPVKIDLKAGKSRLMFNITQGMDNHVLDSYLSIRDLSLSVRPKEGFEGIPILEGDKIHSSTREKERRSREKKAKSRGLWSALFGGPDDANGSSDSDDDPRIKKQQALLSASNETTADPRVAADIHIFSVASGHLYERFLRIMIVSVLKHTKSRVKFWFIANFLSPEFTRTIPYLATALGFEVELVSYSWPHWLRKQTDKQRMIWAYKILFLDVLFPVNLDKVIFVDADQIVRADLLELTRIDLKGAPYGFTPMGDSRRETEGYRFWKTGYWKSHLQGRPYHISALFVVDLARFRQLATGDLIRGHYQALSADPNSLSNLDQDLPNNLQSIVPIHSLPMEWLWCETWCDDTSLAKAKTIDLCNNPLTKEPKLKRAKRLLPEWTLYDEAIAKMLDWLREYEATSGSTMTWLQFYHMKNKSSPEPSRNVEHVDL